MIDAKTARDRIRKRTYEKFVEAKATIEKAVTDAIHASRGHANVDVDEAAYEQVLVWLDGLGYGAVKGDRHEGKIAITISW